MRARETNWKRAALAGCVVLAALLRSWAAQGDIWLDELWSVDWAARASSVWDILFVNHYDNNHILNTVYLHFVGWRENPVWYRLFSILTGTGTVALVALAGFRRGFGEGFTAAFLAGFSYPLILYSSEARGFAPAAFFAVACFLLITEGRRTGGMWPLALFWIAAVLGFLSHLTFLFVYLSLIAWSFARVSPRSWTNRGFWADAVRLHGVPLAGLAFLYVVHVRNLVISGGPIYGTWEVVRTAALLAAGFPEESALGAAVVCAICVMFALGLFQLRKDEPGRWVFFLFAVLLSPLIVLVLKRPKYLYFRYFIVCFPFLYLLAARVLISLYRSSRAGRAAYVLVLLLFLAGNAVPVYRLLALGRGQYRAALEYMAEHTPGRSVVVGSDHDVRNEPLIRYYARFLPADKRVVYMRRDAWTERGPDWLIRHAQDRRYDPPQRLDDFRGGKYTLAASFPYGGISGWRWFLYVNAARSNEDTPSLPKEMDAPPKKTESLTKETVVP